MKRLVHALGHLKINVAELDAAVAEATDILGLRVARETNKEVWLSANGRAAELVFVRAEENSAHTIGLEVLTSEALHEAASRIEGAGCRIQSHEPSMECMDEGVTFVTPEGLRFELHTPIRDDMYQPRYLTSGVGPRRLDHLNLMTPNPEVTRAQLTAIGGMMMSERMINDAVSWMSAGNRQHHIVGVVKGKVGVHHYAYEISDFSAYLKLGDTMDRCNREVMWGPGRHRAGDNTYAYFVSVAGVIVECSSSMATIADDKDFVPKVITNTKYPDNVREMNVWGSSAPEEWRKHHFPFQNLN